MTTATNRRISLRTLFLGQHSNRELTMRVGTTFPQQAVGADPGAVLEFVQAAEDIGYDHRVVSDHVLGADRSYHQALTGPASLSPNPPNEGMWEAF